MRQNKGRQARRPRQLGSAPSGLAALLGRLAASLPLAMGIKPSAGALQNAECPAEAQSEAEQRRQEHERPSESNRDRANACAAAIHRIALVGMQYDLNDESDHGRDQRGNDADGERLEVNHRQRPETPCETRRNIPRRNIPRMLPPAPSMRSFPRAVAPAARACASL